MIAGMLQRRAMRQSARCLAAYKDKAGGILFTPGPLSTTASVKEAMQVDYGSRDSFFVDAVAEMRAGLLNAAGAKEEEYTCVPMQGSGSMGVESVLSSLIPRGGKIIIFRNGAYGDRMKGICEQIGVEVVFHNGAEDQPIDLAAAEALVKEHPDADMVSIVHCETSTGVFNPIQGIRDLLDKHSHKALYFIDAMSSFGGVSMDINALRCDALVSSSNKCVQGVPGFSILIVKREVVQRCGEAGYARSYTLDLCRQDAGLNKSGQFNNTPPVQSIMAFRQALRELEAEGGVPAREKRYQSNQQIVTEGMKAIGFNLYLDDSADSFGHIISSFYFPDHPAWDFTAFYNKLNDRGFVIYPGKAAGAACFRIGHIGDILPEDSAALLVAVQEVLAEMGVALQPRIAFEAAEAAGVAHA